jgi:hypothetical protein
MRNGSKPCRLRPVGRTPACAAGRRRAPARMKPPSSACRCASISWSSPAGGWRSELRSTLRARVSPSAPASERRLAPSTSASAIIRARSRTRASIGHRQQHVDALLGEAARRRRAGRAGSACIRAPARLRRACRCAARARPRRVGGARSSAAACDWISSASRRAPASASGASCAPALERRLQIEQPAIQAGIGDRRRQIADQRRAERRLAIAPSEGLFEA